MSAVNPVPRLIAAVLTAAFAFGGDVAAQASVLDAAAKFVPHRATYLLTLERGRGSGDISSAEGRMDFEWSDVCDGWVVKQDSRVVLGYSEGQRIDFGWKVNAWEGKDGLRYRFFITRFSDGMATEEVRGEARLPEIGAAGTASFSAPQAREVSLPRGTIFPTWHSFEILDLATRDELPLWRIVFDGSGEADGLTAVSVVQAKTFAEQREGLLDSPLVQMMPSWQVLLAYYDLGQTESAPTHEQELRLFPTGVAEDFIFDYGDFALRARLLDLEALPDPGC